jgi:hypothetical protein
MTVEQIAATCEKEKRMFLLTMMGNRRHKEALHDTETLMKEFDDLWNAWSPILELLDERGYSPWNIDLNTIILKT